MSTYLQLNSSLFGEQSQSTRLATEFVAQRVRAEQAQAPDAPRPVVIVRDVGRDPIAHLSAERFKALSTPAESRTPEQRQVVAESDALVAELQAADVIVIGLPMYNFGVPSTLKAYFDHIARAGVTFRYTESGPVGMLTGKRAYVIATRGGRHAGTPADLQSAYVRQFLGFLGIVDIEFVYAEGLALGEASRATALDEASQRIGQLAA